MKDSAFTHLHKTIRIVKTTNKDKGFSRGQVVETIKVKVIREKIFLKNDQTNGIINIGERICFQRLLFFSRKIYYLLLQYETRGSDLRKH